MRLVALLFLSLMSFGLFGSTTSLVEALVAKCDRIDDDYMKDKTGREARLAIMRSLNGEIGPIRYVHAKFGKDKSVRETAFGKTYTGPERGPHVFPTEGKYVAEVSPEMKKRIQGWFDEVKKSGDPAACAELASALFTEAVTGHGNLDEAKMYKLYQVAAEEGHAGANFMCAVCRYYGIGVTRDRTKAGKILKRWKELSGTTQATRGGWIARRFETINK